MSEFHFLRPLWLGALLLLPLVWLRVRHRHSVRGAWTSIIDPRLQPYVLTNSARSDTRSWAWLWYVLASLLIVALAGPTWKNCRSRFLSSNNHWSSRWIFRNP